MQITQELNKSDIELINKLDGPIVVIGASGFIGANLLSVLCKVRDDVFGTFYSKKGWRLLDFDSEKLIKLDINDENSINEMVKKIYPKIVFNCSSYGAYSFEKDSAKILNTNYNAITKLVKILKTYPISAFIHSGSSSEYGENCSGPSESDFCSPNSNYSLSKLAATNYLREVSKNNDFPCIILRLYSIYGPLEDTSRLVPAIVLNALEDKFPELVNPDISRDFVYISDVCNAFIKSACIINKRMYGEIFNIGSGEKTTIRNIVDISKNVFKIRKKPSFGKMKKRRWDLKDWYSNPQKAEVILNWKSITSLELGLKQTSMWIRTINDKKRLTKKEDEK